MRYRKLSINQSFNILFSKRVEEPSDPLNDSGIDEFTSPSSFHDILTVNGQDSLCDTGNDHCSDLS